MSRNGTRILGALVIVGKDSQGRRLLLPKNHLAVRNDHDKESIKNRLKTFFRGLVMAFRKQVDNVKVKNRRKFNKSDSLNYCYYYMKEVNSILDPLIKSYWEQKYKDNLYR